MNIQIIDFDTAIVDNILNMELYLKHIYMIDIEKPCIQSAINSGIDFYSGNTILHNTKYDDRIVFKDYLLHCEEEPAAIFCDINAENNSYFYTHIFALNGRSYSFNYWSLQTNKSTEEKLYIKLKYNIHDDDEIIFW